MVRTTRPHPAFAARITSIRRGRAPSTMNCTAITVTSSPIRRVITFSPVFPKKRTSRGAAESAAQAMASTSTTAPKTIPARTVVPASAYRLTNNTTAFTVDAPAAGVIVLGEAWLEHDFTATVNGQPADLFRVNHAFKGLSVPQGGTYQITVRYRPHRFNLTLGLCFLGLAATGGTGWWVYKRFPAAPTHAG